MSKTFKRLFISINLPEPIRKELESVNSFIRHPSVRWTPQQNLHITLHFIGETQVAHIPRFKENIRKVTAKTCPFKLDLENLKVIRKHRTPAMIWACFLGSAAFTELAVQLQNALPGDNSKTPLPHITLARIKRGEGLRIPIVPELQKMELEVKNIQLMESDLTHAIPVYKTVKSFDLRG